MFKYVYSIYNRRLYVCFSVRIFVSLVIMPVCQLLSVKCLNINIVKYLLVF